MRMIPLTSVVTWLTFGAVIFIAWQIGGNLGREQALQNAVGKTVGKAINIPRPGETLLVSMDAALANDSCDLAIISYAVGKDDVFPLGYIKHPREFLAKVKDEKSLVVPIPIPITTKEGEYSLLYFVDYTCNAIQRLNSRPVTLQPIPFNVRNK